MRLPPSVRYLPSRFKAVLNPWLWLAVLVTGVVGVYAWEYQRNPGRLPWQISTGSSGALDDGTPTDALLEALTPEEQAVASELDNIELLLNQLDADISALTTGGEGSAAASLNTAPTNTDVGRSNAPGLDNFVGESSVERLNRYIDEYRFLGASPSEANSQPTEDSETARSSALTLRSESQASQNSALADALTRQQAEQEATLPESANPRAESGLPQPSSTANNTGEASNFSFGQTDVIPGSLGGLNQPFIRTTPNMSPPPGTTGYVPPTSLQQFNQLTQPSGANPFGTQPATPNTFGNTGLTTPNQTQTLPPSGISTTAPLETQTFDDFSEPVEDQPRNAWEAFFD